MDKTIKEIIQDLANAIVRGDTMVPVCSVGPLLARIERLEMTREDFINNYSPNTLCLWSDDRNQDSILKSLIGSIYDLQQQIAQKDEFIDYLDNRLINLEQEVYK